MKKSMSLAAICLALFGCGEDPQDLCPPSAQWVETALPDSVEFGRTVVFLNGKEANYSPTFVYQSYYGLMNYGFQEQVGDILNGFVFAKLPLKGGNYGLHSKAQQPRLDKAFAGFGQIVDEDLPGYSYELEESVGGFLHIEHLDSVSQIVKGRFKVAFCRTSTNGYGDLGLPGQLLFQGVFNTKYSKQ